MQADLFTSTSPALHLPNADIEYREQFFTQADALYQQLWHEIEWRQDTISMYGKPVLIPRLNAWYGDADAHYSYSGLQLTPLPWTPALLTVKKQVERYIGESFNSVLANCYRDGNDSVAWHSDDEFELGKQPLIASVSFGATRRFVLKHRKDKKLSPVNLELSSGSLLIMQGSTQQYWHHCVPKQKGVTESRINLTFRQILHRRPEGKR